MKKIVSIILALAMVMALAAPAFAADEYTATLGFADGSWSKQIWDDATVTITGDGQYSIETDLAAGASGIQVFVIDLKGLNAAVPEATVVLDSIEVDGAPVEFDASKILYGDLEGNGNLRIEIYNEFGAGTASNSPLTAAAFSVGSTLKVTFTVSGTGVAAAPADDAAAPVEDGTAADNNAVEPETTTSSNEDTTAAPAPATTAPKTGLALAVVPMVIAAAAAAVSKKR